MKKRKKWKLKTKLFIGLGGFGLLIMIVLSVVVGIFHFTATFSEYMDTAFSMSRAAARFIDGDRVPGYLDVVGTDESGAPVYYTDDYYDEVMAYLVSLETEYDLMRYFYVFIPDGETCTYIWDATSADIYSPRGEVSDLSPKERQYIYKAFRREPVEEALVDADSVWGNLMSAFSPIFNSDGDPVAVVGVDLSLDGMMTTLFAYLLLIVITVVLVTAISIFILYRIVRRLVLRPIEQLNMASQSMVGELSGESHFDLEIHSGDEMEELANSFRKMDEDIRDYFSRLTTVTADQERVHAEFSIVKQIQKDILPNAFPAFPERRDFDIYAALYPSSQIGGDYYDFFLIDDDHLGMVVGDVAGKGVPAALYMVIVESLTMSRAMQGYSPAEILQNVNEQMLKYDMDQFSMVWFAILDLSTGKGIAANAGHEHPILRRAGKRFELLEYRHSAPVGAVEGVRFRDHGFQLAPGDCLFIYSDGVREAFNQKGEMFGRQGILDSLNREPEATPSVLLQTVKADIDRFTGDVQQIDDMVMLSLIYYGRNGEGDRI